MAEKKQNEIKYGACRYCGQTNREEAAWQTQEEADEYATTECDCNEAKNYQWELEENDRKREAREETIKNAHSKIKELFGSDVEKYGVMSAEESIQDIMWQCSVLVYDEKIKNITIGISPNTKAKISKTGSGRLLIVRSDSAGMKREV